MPTNRAELKSVLADAVTKGVTVRASGQRHSQPPLVTNDNRGAVPPLPTTYLVDMSCYADLGPGSKDVMVLGPGPNQVTVNPGIREDELDAFLTQHNLILDTVTAGGFFSIGGMTAVDVHGGTVDAPIFAEAVSAFTILGADGNETIIDGWGRSLAPGVRARIAGRTRHRDQNDARRPAPALGEHAPRGNTEIPAPNKLGFRCKVQRTVDGTDETYPG
jgi:FAD/FMN-containing dehydrogenase